MPLTLDDIPSSFTVPYLKKNRNATDDEIIKAYQEQQQGEQETHVYWEDRGATGRRV